MQTGIFTVEDQNLGVTFELEVTFEDGRFELEHIAMPDFDNAAVSPKMARQWGVRFLKTKAGKRLARESLEV